MCQRDFQKPVYAKRLLALYDHPIMLGPPFNIFFLFTLRVLLQLMDSAAVTSTESGRDGILCPTVQWLQDHLLPKLCKWAEEIPTNDQGRKGSLRLVPLDQYTLLYHRLKQDHGEKLVKVQKLHCCLILFW